jgi:hypothetical protein
MRAVSCQDVENVPRLHRGTHRLSPYLHIPVVLQICKGLTLNTLLCYAVITC